MPTPTPWQPSLLLLTTVIGLCAGCAADPDAPTQASFWTTPSDWVFEDSTLWSFDGQKLDLVIPGEQRSDIRRPGAVALAAGSERTGSFHLRAEVRSTQDTTVVGRDVILVFGYRSPREFYYAHLSKDNTIMPHNGIFLVNEADRLRIDDQGLQNPPEARLTDSEWHHVRVDRDSTSGTVRVFVDDLRSPLMTATDTTFRSGAIGFGSFDDTGGIRNLRYFRGPAPLLDPIRSRPKRSGLAVQLEAFARLPASDTTGGPMARINFLDHANDGTDRLFVNDLRGILYVIENGHARPYLDVSSKFADFVDAPGLGAGLGFFAFHPDFDSTGLLYTVHTEAGDALREHAPDYNSGSEDIIHGVIVEWTATDPKASVFSGSNRELLRLGFGTPLHGIQQIGFSPEAATARDDRGLLYVAVGDGEVPGGQTSRPQLLTTHAGKIFRIDPAGSDGPGGKYGIPRSNPFVDVPDALGEIWALGLRNPHRFSWDTETGKMYIGHIGEAQVDAVFPGIAGANYGWNLREGGLRYERDDPYQVYPLPLSAADAGFVPPVIKMDHDDMAALIGGFVYRGQHIPELIGKYVFGDLSAGTLYYAEAADLVPGGSDTPIQILTIMDPDGVVRSMAHFSGRARAEIRFGRDASGEIYVLSKANGSIWKITAATPSAGR